MSSWITWLGDWHKGPYGERYKLAKLGELSVKLRSLYGGDERYRPVIEITQSQAVRKIGPRGGKSVPTRHVESHLGKPESSHLKSISQGLSWLNEWWTARTK